MAWFINLLIGIALNIIAYVLLPRPKQPKPPAARDQDNPVAEAGKPLPVVFGSITVKGLNYLGYWDKDIRTRQVSVGGKK